MMFPSVNEQMDLIKAGTIEIIPEEELAEKIERSIKNKKPLIAKLGCDPSKPDLHIGHAVVLRKLRDFQDLGHIAVLIIGDFTAMIGDPTGKNKTRPQLTLEETRINGNTYLEQATKILSQKNLQIRYNSEWLNQLDFRSVIELSSKYTVAQLLERDDFSKRYKSGIPISIHELLYPLAQAYDSYAINSDIELGGTDQKFNLLVGREIQKAYGQEPQCILTMPILEGIDGIEKMSKSLNNYIGITDSPRDMFGKIMSIPDNLIIRYLKYAAYMSDDEIKQFEMKMERNEINPRDLKAILGRKVVSIYYDEETANQASDEFDRMFRDKGLPDEIQEMILNLEKPVANIADLLTLTNLAPSKKEARRLIQQGAVSIDGEKIIDAMANINLEKPILIKCGKKKFLKVKMQ